MRTPTQLGLGAEINLKGSLGPEGRGERQSLHPKLNWCGTSSSLAANKRPNRRPREAVFLWGGSEAPGPRSEGNEAGGVHAWELQAVCPCVSVSSLQSFLPPESQPFGPHPGKAAPVRRREGREWGPQRGAAGEVRTDDPCLSAVPSAWKDEVCDLKHSIQSSEINTHRPDSTLTSIISKTISPPLPAAGHYHLPHPLSVTGR